MSHFCEYCTWDEDGNPEVCMGPPSEEPDFDDFYDGSPLHEPIQPNIVVAYTDEAPF